MSTSASMAHRLTLAGLAAITLLGLPLRAQATPFDDQPKLLLHARGATIKAVCRDAGSLSDCRTAVTNAQVAKDVTGPFYFVYLLVAEGFLRGAPLGGTDLGLAGFQCGIQYNPLPSQGVDVFSWALCATLEFHLPDWPQPGSGNLVTWDPVNICQLGEVGVAGYFYCAAYGPDVMQLIPRPVDGKARVADCNAFPYELTTADLGSVRFTPQGQAAGCNPCVQSCAMPAPVARATWSQIKGLLGGDR